MRKFCEDCQEETDHFGDVCLECYYVSDSEDDSSDYSEHESDREFINDDSESEDESDMVKSSNVIQAKNERSLFFRTCYESESEDESDMEY